MSESINDGREKLWDNEELVMKALKCYGKMPRPQVYTEISRVCQLPNMRRCRYFHEKMMKTNPFKDKIMKLIADEGEHTYPYFRIFFEEFKTKQQRQSLLKTEQHGAAINSVENSVDNTNSNDFEQHSNSDQFFYYNQSTEANQYNSTDQYNGHENDDNDYIDDPDANDTYNNANATQLDATSSYNHMDHQNQNTPTDPTYLENLELKLKILSREKEDMLQYFDTFTTVIDNLKEELSGKGIDQEKVDIKKEKLDINALKTQNFDDLKNEHLRMIKHIEELKENGVNLERAQGVLRADFKVGKRFVDCENIRLRSELDELRTEMAFREQETVELKRRLAVAESKRMDVQNVASVSRIKLNEMRESMERMFTQINNLQA